MRRLYKTISWSILALTITCVIGYLVTGDLAKGGLIGLTCRGIKIPAYYLHDLLYAKIW